jgi:hypothetical protein
MPASDALIVSAHEVTLKSRSRQRVGYVVSIKQNSPATVGKQKPLRVFGLPRQVKELQRDTIEINLLAIVQRPVNSHAFVPKAGIRHWTYTGPYIPQVGQERVHLNLWLLNGRAPASGAGDEMLVDSFSFQPWARCVPL